MVSGPLDYSTDLVIRPRWRHALGLMMALAVTGVLLVFGIWLAGPLLGNARSPGDFPRVMRTAAGIAAVLAAPGVIMWLMDRRRAWVATPEGLDVLRWGKPQAHIPWGRILEIKVLLLATEVRYEADQRRNVTRLHWIHMRDGRALGERWASRETTVVLVRDSSDLAVWRIQPPEGGTVEGR